MSTITVETYPEQESWYAAQSLALYKEFRTRTRIVYMTAYNDMRSMGRTMFNPFGYESVLHAARLSYFDRPTWSYNPEATLRAQRTYWRSWIKSGRKISNVAGNESRRYVERQIKELYASDFKRLISEHKSIGF